MVSVRVSDPGKSPYRLGVVSEHSKVLKASAIEGRDSKGDELEQV